MSDNRVQLDLEDPLAEIMPDSEVVTVTLGVLRRLKSQLATQAERVRVYEKALDEIIAEYNNHDVVGIDVMYQIAKDARVSPVPESPVQEGEDG
jgi:hypothetical protein